MDPLHVLDDIKGADFSPALTGVDVGMLVEEGLNRPALDYTRPEVEPEKISPDVFADDHDMLPAEPFLNMDVLVGLSPRNSSEQENDVDADSAPELLIGANNSPLRIPGSPCKLVEPIVEGALEKSLSLTSLLPTQHPVPDLDPKRPLESSPSISTRPLMQHALLSPLGFRSDSGPLLEDTTRSQSGTHLATGLLDNQLSPPRELQRFSSSSQRPKTTGKSRKKTKASLNLAKVPFKPSRNSTENLKAGKDTLESSAIRLPPRSCSASAKGSKKGQPRRRGSANAHLSLEERKKLRAERNRESAEKSRMRRKQMVLELETNVALLREENNELKARVEKYHLSLRSASSEMSDEQSPFNSTLCQTEIQDAPSVYEALRAIQQCIDECPRTFRRGPHSPLIPLNIRK